MSAIELNLSGWVLRKPKVAESNSPNTSAPDTQELSGFSPTERADYMVAALNNGWMHEIEFAWVANKDRGQFGFSDADQRWTPLPGRSPLSLGSLSNTERLVAAPIPTDTYPYRFYISDPSSSDLTTFNVVSSFTSPASLAAGTVEIHDTSGELNFSQDDVDDFEGDAVYYQTEGFVNYGDESKYRLGALEDPLDAYRLALNPIPSPTQFPIIRIGNRLPLTPVAVNTEANFTSPSAGTVQWAKDKGTLNFSSTDITNYEGDMVYYWGAYDSFDSPGSPGLSAKTYSLGTIDISNPANPTTTGSMPPSAVPSSGGDVIIYFTFATAYRRVTETNIVSSFSTTVKYGEVELKTDGTIKFNYAEARRYKIPLSWNVYAVVCDYDLSSEDVGVRYFRSLVNKDGSDSDVTDLNCLVTVEDQTLISGLIASPIQALPVSPIEPPLSAPYKNPSFRIEGKGITTLQDLKTSSSAGVGFLLDYETKELTLAYRRKFDISLDTDASFYNFEDVGIVQYGFVLRDGPEAGPNTDMSEGDDYLLESNGGAIFFINRFGKTLDTGTKGQVTSATTFRDTTADFTGFAGKQLVILSGPNKASYLIDSITSSVELEIESSIPFPSTGTRIAYEIWDEPEILGDRVWEELQLPEDYFKLKKLFPIGTISNSPRRTIPIVDISARVEFQLDADTIDISWVETNGDFGTPSAGTAEVSKETGDVNFSAADLTTYSGQTVWISWWLYPSDYMVNSGNGGIYLNTPLLNWERLKAFYYTEEGGDLQEEHLVVRIWDEICVITPGSVDVPFNPDDRETDSSFGILVYRGDVTSGVGRFYKLSDTETSEKVSVDWDTNTLTFIDPLAGDDEVTVEYYIIDPVGGEKSFTLSTYPIFFPSYDFEVGTNEFIAWGDVSSVFVADQFVFLGGNDIYRVSSSSYASGKTTVTLASYLRKTYKVPTFLVSSQPLDSNYFEPVTERFEKTQKGSYALNFKTIVTGISVGTILTLGGDDYLVLGVAIEDNRTVVQVGSKFPSEYYYTPGALERSIRPVFPDQTTEFVTSLPLVTTEPFTLRLRNKNAGTVEELVLDTDLSVSESGALLLLTKALGSNDILEFNYAGRETYDEDHEFSGEYIYRYVPDDSNQFLGASIIASYTVYNPDTLYFRVEPFNTIALEVSSALGEAAASQAPSSGPPGPPPPPPALNEKGKSTFYWDYGDTVDSDAVARRYLLYYNDVCNLIEDLLAYFDGRVVGDIHGKFLFTDSLYTTPVEPSAAVNHIDSIIYISPAWPAFPSPPFPPGFPPRRSQAMWKGSRYSRLYPEYGKFFGASSPTEGAGPGYSFPDEFLKEIYEIGRENLASISGVKDRPARTKLLNSIASGESSATLEVESASEDGEEFMVPGFAVDDEVMIGRTSNPYLVAGIVTAVDTGSTPNTITVDFVSYSLTPTLPPPSGTTCPALLPNDTVYHNPFWWEDDGGGNPIGHFQTYKTGLDFAVDMKAGNLINMGFPFPLPGQTPIQPLSYLEGKISYGNALTEPYRFPALDGQVYNDWNDREIPFKINATANFDFVFEGEEDLIDAITANTLEGVRDTDGDILSDRQTFEGDIAGYNLEVNDELILLTGSNTGRYLITSFPTSVQAKVAAFKHRQDGTVDYEIWDSTETTLRTSGTTANIQTDLLTLQDTGKNFPVAGVIVGDKLIVNSTSGYYNNGTYWIQTVATTTVSVRAFSTSETGVSFDIKRGTSTTGRASGDTGYFDTTTVFIDPNATWETDELVKGDTLVIPEGKNRGNWRINSIDSETQMTLQDAVRVAEDGTGGSLTDTGANDRLDVSGTVFQSSDVGRKITITGTSNGNDGTYTILSFIDSNSITISGSFPGTLPDTGNWALCVDYKVDDVRRESQYIADWRTKLLEEQSELQDVTFQGILDDLFDTLYDTSAFVSGTSGAVTGAQTFQDTSKDFEVLGVVKGDILEISSGVNAGMWWVEEVSGDTITIPSTDAFPSTDTGLSYDVWQGNTRFSEDMRRTLMDFLNLINGALNDITATLPYSQIDTNPDYGDPTDTFLGNRQDDVQDFRTELAEFPERFETALQYIDKLYDKRFSWIDYRVNLEQGTLPTKERLLNEKEKNERDLIKKLLMVQG